MYTLGTAAKATGRSKSTIQRAIKDGTISANKNDKGQYEIDPAELHRVFDATSHDTEDETPRNASETGDDTAVLKAQLEALNQLAEERSRTIDDLRERLDKEGEERRKLTMMITDQREREPEKRGFWKRLTGS